MSLFVCLYVVHMLHTAYLQLLSHVVTGDSLLFFPKCVFSLQGEKDLKMLTFSPDGEKLTDIQVFFT